MTQRNNILQELEELQSSLPNPENHNLYAVPAGYFENLITEVLNRIKSLDADSPTEELNYLSPLLNNVSRAMPFSLPPGFFDEQDERTMQIIGRNNEQTADEELKTLSPLLRALTKQMPYSLPQGYFEEMKEPRKAEEVKAAKVVSIANRKWFRYAAAAAVIGFIAAGSFTWWSKKSNIDPKTQSSAWVEKSMNKVSTNDIDNFVQLTDEQAPVIASFDAKSEVKDKNDIKEMIKDIPDKDIQNFLDDTGNDNSDNGDDALMN